MPGNVSPGTWKVPYSGWPLNEQIGVDRGLVTTKDTVTYLTPINVAEEIAFLTKDTSPLLWISRQIAKAETFDVVFRWLEDDYAPHSIKFGATGESTTPGTTLQLAAGMAKRVRVGDILFVPRTGERMRVTAVNTANDQITVVRNWGNYLPNPVLLAANEQILLVGLASEQAGGAPESLRTIQRAEYNYTQIVKRGYEIAGSEGSIGHIKGHGPTDQYLEKKVIVEFQRERELAYLFGVRHEDLSGAKPIYTTGGFLFFLKGNCPELDLSGGWTSSTLRAFIGWTKEVFFYDPQPRYLLVSPDLMAFLIENFSTNIQGVTRFKDLHDDRFEMDLQVLNFGFGELRLVAHPLLRQVASSTFPDSTNPKYVGIAVLPENIRMRYLSANGRSRESLRFERGFTNEQLLDSKAVMYLSECGFELRTPEKFGLIKA
ncbi:MAG: hypothetical protein ACK42I_02470 [Thermomicrobium sp.]